MIESNTLPLRQAEILFKNEALKNISSTRVSVLEKLTSPYIFNREDGVSSVADALGLYCERTGVTVEDPLESAVKEFILDLIKLCALLQVGQGDLACLIPPHFNIELDHGK